MFLRLCVRAPRTDSMVALAGVGGS
jgi:hypothetical protein